MTGSGPPTAFWRQRRDAPSLRPEELHATALSMLAARRAIRGTIPADFVHDPALEMLLVAYLARPAPVAAGELVVQTTVSATVAGHWLEALKAEGLLAAAGDMIALTEDGLAAMDAMLAAVVDSQRELLGWGGH